MSRTLLEPAQIAQTVFDPGTETIKVSGTFTESATAADGGALPAEVKVVGGYDGTNVQVIKTDSSGELQIDVLSSALPSGAATSANQTNKTQYTRLTDGTDDALVTAAGELNVLAAAQPGIDIGDVTINNAAGASAVNIQDGGNSITVDGTVAATQSGTWTTTTTNAGFSNSQFIRNDYSSVNVTTGAYVQLIASTSAAYKEIEIFDSSGQTLKLAFGAAASEVDKFLIFPGGNGRLSFQVPASTRISIRAVSASATAGEISLNLYG